MAAKVDKKKVSAEGKKVFSEALAATSGMIKAATDQQALLKQTKASRDKLKKLAKAKPYDGKKAKAALDKHKALVKQVKQKIANANKAESAKLEGATKKLEGFAKKNQAAFGKKGGAQMGTLSKKLGTQVKQNKQVTAKLGK